VLWDSVAFLGHTEYNYRDSFEIFIIPVVAKTEYLMDNVLSNVQMFLRVLGDICAAFIMSQD